MCDVKNPLCGKNGATFTFGAQKGATPRVQEKLEEGMCKYRDVIKKEFGVDCDNIEGTGAAGGLGAFCIRNDTHAYRYIRIWSGFILFLIPD